jgi:hypothetical protein
LTGNAEAFVRQWWEVEITRTSLQSVSRSLVADSAAKWFPYNKGGEFRRWYGNHEHVVNWEFDGQHIRQFGTEFGGRPRSRPQNVEFYFRPSVSWTNVSSGETAFRAYPAGFISAGSTGDGVFPESTAELYSLLGYMNSSTAAAFLRAIAPGLTFNVGEIASLPVTDEFDKFANQRVEALKDISKADWDTQELSWGFERNPILELVQRFEPTTEHLDDF